MIIFSHGILLTSVLDICTKFMNAHFHCQSLSPPQGISSPHLNSIQSMEYDDVVKVLTSMS